jgi:membrane protein implicated in regulation of membrane protease activity
MTVVMFLQLILMIIGVGFGSEADGDIDDGSIDSNAETTPPDSRGSSNTNTFKIFTIRGIVAFFALGGWAGLAALAAGLHPFWAIQISLFIGVCALLLASIIIRLALRMQTSGNINLNNAISQTAEVYIRIPSERSDKGKVTMILQERFVELDAVTDNDTDIMPESKVEVQAIINGDCLVVSPVKEER